MNPLLGILLAAVLFAVFGVFHRRGEGAASCGTDPRGCDRAGAEGGCGACHETNPESSESSHGRS